MTFPVFGWPQMHTSWLKAFCMSAAALLVPQPVWTQDATAVGTGSAAGIPVSVTDENTARPEGFPEIGKWMLGPDGRPADWLGEVYRGKNLREPINVVIEDEAAADAIEAKLRIIEACRQAGYPVRMGHSSGYQANIGGVRQHQLPIGRDDAFSDAPFEVSNNHGRIFGPFAAVTGYVFVAAFSREEVDPFTEPKHRYGSFNRARDDFTQKLDERTDFKVTGFVDLKNAILDDQKLTTVEHDGLAVLVRSSPAPSGAGAP